MHWIFQHKDEIQALTNVVIAVLTVVLIFLTAVYSHANRRTMKIMEADLRFRTKPIPKIVLARSADEAARSFQWKLTVTVTNAPLLFRELKLFFHQKNHRHMEYLQVQRRILRPGEEFSREASFYPSDPVLDWSAEVKYSDLTGLVTYKTSFTSEENDFGYEEVIPKLGPIAFFWWRCKERYKEMRSGGSLQEKLDKLNR
jgi:hypothetical protein